ncbi:MAG TPA: hypothetical protein VHI77_10500 [Solirubrobacterales bacterium]|nr:hypothetical protein [Solirubrobacterales bacterium]
MPINAFTLAALAALLALALAGCGSGTMTESATVSQQAPRAGTPGPHEGSPNARPASTCETELSAFLGTLGRLRRRLVAGLTYEQYVSEIEAIRSAYGAVPLKELDVGCLTAAGGPAEASFNTYIEAGNDWGRCVGAPGCEAVTVEPVLQRKWRAAAKALSEAQAGLANATSSPARAALTR